MGSKLNVTSQEGEGSCFFFEIEFSKCNSIEKLNKQIINPPIYLIPSSNQKSKTVALQLEHFELDFIVITFDELIVKKNQQHIVITFESEQCQVLVNKTYHVILIEDIKVNKKTILDDSIYHIQSFSQYPSELYNAILELNYLPTDKETKTAKNKKIRLNILIAEDYDINRILINEMLMKYDIKPDFAMNGEEAVEMAKKYDYDLILMDINMPKMNGIDATIALRKLSIAVPIIALTANALEGDKEYFLSVGMNDYISKPINPKSLHDFLLKYSKNKDDLITNDNSEVCDIKQLLNSLQNAKKTMHFNNTIITRLFTSFINSTYVLLEEIDKGIQTNNKDKIREKMHALRGILLSLQINKLAKICENIEYDKNELEDETFMSLSQKVHDTIVFIQEQKDNILEGIKDLD
jgi:CheY-like chemotaxis protein